MKKKKSKFVDAPPAASDINEANALIEELWEQLRYYEDKLKTGCSNSSKPPSTDGPKEWAERKKLKTRMTAIREEINRVSTTTLETEEIGHPIPQQAILSASSSRNTKTNGRDL